MESTMFARFAHRLAAASIALAVAAPALATDGKLYTPSSCHPSGNVSFFFGRAYNIGAGTATLDCPVVKDSIGGIVERAFAWVVDQSFIDDVRCTLGVWNATTPGVIGVFETRSSVGTNPNPQQLNFLAKPSISPGYIDLRCIVPGVYDGFRSQVAGYRVDEAS
jgi:hypothetical protein